ncbi:30S ribosomal protein S5 [Candidatus Parcubacteria bacterium]|uniref:Small ribosomal subunit protein uS5 n=1 Tax=Candidatus Kaiserbacteria bacterium CG10_big_fil_rev_8_21_14_0_10_47_16 TaxID=1974608 RepID=A0A2H0UDT2_9BACT|nr:30S ribosomal protein S5 [Candidatus Parcubacteria bacterium]PIR84588.1 MAG: 30S ribosomal protein S5 [Candidatus Kaiserbacteria bacterium CG10_big_fil_rev_8_21_14_0_10_47_16]
MTENTTKDSVPTTPVATEGQPETAAPQTAGAPASETPDERKRNPRRPRRARRGGNRREERARPEFEQKIISIRRVTRVMAGGRRFSFSVAMVIGDKRGKVGVGIGKAGDTQLAIEKAYRDAKKNIMTVPMNKTQHIPHDVTIKYASSEVMIMPAPGRGLVAGSSVRTVLELAGVKDVTAKLLSRSKNKLNNARAAIAALELLKA